MVILIKLANSNHCKNATHLTFEKYYCIKMRIKSFKVLCIKIEMKLGEIKNLQHCCCRITKGFSIKGCSLINRIFLFQLNITIASRSFCKHKSKMLENVAIIKLAVMPFFFIEMKNGILQLFYSFLSVLSNPLHLNI